MQEHYTPTEEKLLGIWREFFERTGIGIHDDFFVLGGYSLLVVQLMVFVRAEFGCELPPHQIFDTPTIAELAAHIDQQCAALGSAGRAGSALVPIQPLGSRTPLFCIHDLDGKVFCYQALAAHLGPNQPVYGIEAQGMTGEAPPLTSLAAMAARCIREMHRLQPQGPYHLAGYSFAGLVAYEIAQQLRAAGEPVGVLAILDTLPYFDPTKPRFVTELRRFILSQKQRVKRQLIRMRPQEPGAAPDPAMGFGPAPAAVELQAAAGLRSLAEVNIAAYKRYRIAPYAGPIVYFRAEDQLALSAAHAYQWWAHLTAGDLAFHRVPGGHLTMVKEPHVQAIGQILSTALDRRPVLILY